MLSLSDLGLAVTWLFGAVVNLHTDTISEACIAQGYAMEFFRLSSFMWTGCFAVHLYQIIWKNVKDPEVFELRYHLVSWGIPSLVCCYFLFMNETGHQMMGQSDRPWCWIRDFHDDEWNAFGSHLQYAVFYGPLLVIFAFNLFIYSFLGRKVGELMQTRMKVRIQKRLLLYLLVFQLTSIWGLANRIYQAWSPKHNYSYVLLCLDSAFGPLQGFLNALVYGLNQKLRDRYKEWLCPESSGWYVTFATPMHARALYAHRRHAALPGIPAWCSCSPPLFTALPPPPPPSSLLAAAAAEVARSTRSFLAVKVSCQAS